MRLTNVVRASVVLGVGAALVVAALLALRHARVDATPAAAARDATPVSKGSGEKPAVDRATKVSLGAFRLHGGKRIEVFSAKTTDGRSCVLDESLDGSSGGTCLDGEPFEGRLVAFLVSSEGGPDAFTELRLSGAVAPTVHAVAVLRSDGSRANVGLTPKHAFVFESTLDELGADVLPTAIELYGANGRLLETVTVPPLR